VRAFEAAGDAELSSGRHPGEQKVLNQCLIVGRCPDQLKLPFALWSREAVGQLIAQMTGIQLSLTEPSAAIWRPGTSRRKSRSGG